jgi:prolyl oligopeptidase
MAVLPTIASFGQNQKSIQNQKGETVDLYFDAKVADPYRWLEDDRSAETAALKENKVTYGFKPNSFSRCIKTAWRNYGIMKNRSSF